MSSLFALLVSWAILAAGVTDDRRRRIEEPPGLVFGRAESETALKTQLFKSIFGKEYYDWSVDLEAGTITFTSATKIVTAPVQVIGTYNEADGTFLWGWDHPSVPEPRGADARLARAFGLRNHLPLYTQRKVECTQAQAWTFAAVALYLSGAQGPIARRRGRRWSS